MKPFTWYLTKNGLPREPGRYVLCSLQYDIVDTWRLDKDGIWWLDTCAYLSPFREYEQYLWLQMPNGESK